MVTIYHANGRRGYRAIWACEELNIPYQIAPFGLAPDYRASAEWRRMRTRSEKYRS